MGKKNKDNKKKGKGAEKTSAKTEKKLSNKHKKELAEIGEDDIENIIASIEREEQKRQQVTETLVPPPSRRVNFSFVPHPEKEELILFGGEYFNGQKTCVYNDLYFYNIPHKKWTLVKSPGGPAPRCGHQMVVTSIAGGQLWLFGGEFTSETESQFHHYRDLWVYHLATKKWEKINKAGGPSARSGHRMVCTKKQLLIFGGFHDNLRNYKYFNDVYKFDLETYTWSQLEPTGSVPGARSACNMVALSDARVLIHGGYTKEKIKKDLDKGKVFTDMYMLTPDKNDTTGLKYKWSQLKSAGLNLISARASMTMISTPNNTIAYCFGGVFDHDDDEENISSTFYNDLFSLDLNKIQWTHLVVTNKQNETKKITNEIMETDETINTPTTTTTTSDDGIFTVTVGGSSTASAPGTSTTSKSNSENNCAFQPSPRMNCGLAIKHGILYLYGGIFEHGNKQFTLSDFYSLDIRKMNEWKTLLSDDLSKQEWLDSDSDDDEDEEDSDDSDSDEETSDELMEQS